MELSHSVTECKLSVQSALLDKNNRNKKRKRLFQSVPEKREEKRKTSNYYKTVLRLTKKCMLMSQRNMMFISLLVLFLALTTIHAQNECSGESANCINIRNCPQVISIVTDPRPLSAQMLQTLRNAQCGFEGNNPKYCCNQITTTTTTTVEPEIETDLPDVMNHPNLRLLDHQACDPVPQQRVTTTTATDPEIKTDPPDVTNHQNLHLLGSQSHGPQTYSGNETDIFQYPWMAIIVWIYGPPICSGTIISSRYVLTSASCSQPLYVRDFREMSIRIGDHDTSKHYDYIKDNKGADLVCVQIFDIDTIHSHPKYNRTTMRNDIGLIRLNDTVDFRPRNVKPICLPFGTAATLDRSKAIVTGWGLLLVECCWKLLQKKVSLVTNERCENFKVGFYPNVEKFNYIWYKHLCAEIPLDVNPCLADHGGPLQAAGIYIMAGQCASFSTA